MIGAVLEQNQVAVNQRAHNRVPTPVDAQPVIAACEVRLGLSETRTRDSADSTAQGRGRIIQQVALRDA